MPSLKYHNYFADISKYDMIVELSIKHQEQILVWMKMMAKDLVNKYQVMMMNIGYSNQNPVLFYDDTASILHLFHSEQPANQGESDATIWRCQTDPLSNKVQLFTDTIASSSFDFSTPVELCSSKIYNTPTSDNKGVIFPIYIINKEQIMQ